MRDHTDPFYIHIKDTIEREERQILAIGPDGKSPPFFYSIGNHLKGLPELLLIGPWKPDLGMQALNLLSTQMLERKGPFGNGEQVNIGGDFDFQVWDTTVISKLQYTLQATEFFGHQEYTVQQVVIPDPHGRYPGDKRVHKRYRVPVLRSTAAVMQSMRVH